jgi:hypothetical protein
MTHQRDPAGIYARMMLEEVDGRVNLRLVRNGIEYRHRMVELKAR